MLFFCLLTGTASKAAGVNAYTLLDSGNAAYNKQYYSKAITFYEGFLKGDVESAQAYFNMGNCYYRLNEMPKAILYYEKAKRLTPGDPDVEFNLQLANQKITDKISSDTPLFIYSDWKRFENKMTERQWGIICISLLCISLLLFALYLYISSIFVKQLSFWSAFVILFSCLFTFYIANQQYDLLTSHDTAVIMSPSVTVKGAPDDKATELFVVHEGTKVWVVKNDGIWTEIKLSNGNVGWLVSSDISVI